MFLDEATIEVTGGKGGPGCVSWRREKYEPHGGPNGGNGGKGGDIVIVADENTDTLSDFASRKRFEADKGQFGMGKNKAGHAGDDKILKVPPGTIVVDLSKKTSLLADLREPGQSVIVARGGRGGYGNAHFKSSVRQRPDFAELGEPGEERKLKLELKLVADVGIIGYPSVGKSTVISVISSARPKIAAYPFTTLIPNLGVVQVSGRSYVVCDVPGLIEGASEGKGLGLRFLKHIERCGVLLHVLDVSRAFPHGSTDLEELDPLKLVDDYKAIRAELKAYSPALADKRELIVLNKIDLLNNDASALEKALKKHGIKLFLSMSAAGRVGVDELKKKLLPIVLKEREHRVKDEEDEIEEKRKVLPVLQPHLSSQGMDSYRIEKTTDGIVVRGKRLEQLTSMTNFQSEGALRRFQDVVKRIGLKKAIEKMRKDEETPVFIGKMQVDEYL